MDSVAHQNTSVDRENGNGPAVKQDPFEVEDNFDNTYNSNHYGSTPMQNESNSEGTDSSILIQPTTKLIVNYLPQPLTDDEFRGLFLACGQVKSSKICRDRQSGFSYGFGFVEFFNLDDAAKAIELLNGHVIGSKRLKVAYSRPPSREMHEANLYMRGLPKSWDEVQLKKYCSSYGSIIQVRILKDLSTGQSRGTGFVLFNKKTEADACREALNGQILPESTEALVVKIAEGPGGNEQKVRPPPGVVPQQAIMPHHPMLPGHHLPYQTPPMMASDPMNRYFQQPFAQAPSLGGPVRTGTAAPRMRYNPMANPSVKTHMAKQSQPPVVGYPQMLSRHPYPNIASTAEMVGLNTPVLPVAGAGPRPSSRPPFSQRAVSAPPPPPPCASGSSQLGSFDCANDAASQGGYQLFVYNCGTTCDEKELYELFGPYGAISKVDVVRDPTNGNTKFAFVTMLDYNQAQQAIQALNGYCYTPKPMQVKFKNPPAGHTK